MFGFWEDMFWDGEEGNWKLAADYSNEFVQVT